MTIIVEERLVLELGPSWDVVKYDEHPLHKDGIGCLQRAMICRECLEKVVCARCGKGSGEGTKAVDIVGQRQGCLYLIEVKDFRKYRIENRRRLLDGDLAVEVALKVRDTLAGLAGAVHARSSERWRAWAELMLKRPPKVLLWLEQDRAEGDDRGRGRPLTLKDRLDQNLQWLHPHVMVVDQHRCSLPDITVKNLSDRVFAVRSLMKKRPLAEGLTTDEYAGAMSVTANVAREQTAKLCERDALKRVGGEERFVPGRRWAEFCEEPR